MLPPFVKKFDFRGVYNQDIKDQDAFYLGLAIQKTLPLKKVLIGWDTRESSRNLAMQFINALKDSPIEISYLEQCPIDYVTAGAHAFDFDFSVMFTGSHNPWDWTGLLMHTKGGASVEGPLVDLIVKNYNESLHLPYEAKSVDLSSFTKFERTIENIYAGKMLELLPLDTIKAMKVLVDVGDGSGYKSLDVVAALLPQVTFEKINNRKLYNADTPHTADPSNIENMEQLMQAVSEKKFACGFAFDSDADRVLAVDEQGNYINGSLLGSAMIDVFTTIKSRMKQFGYAVECGPAMYNTVLDLQKKEGLDVSATAVPVGRSILRRMIRSGEVSMAAENVGHFYVKDFFMTDSGAFSLLVTLLWISQNGELSGLTDLHPDGQRTQFSLPKQDNQEETNNALAQSINEKFDGSEQKRISVDGIRYEFFESDRLTSWYAIRPSGYEPREKYYFGSLDEKAYGILQEKLKKE
jgi:phosphomannomutase